MSLAVGGVTPYARCHDEGFKRPYLCLGIVNLEKSSLSTRVNNGVMTGNLQHIIGYIWRPFPMDYVHGYSSAENTKALFIITELLLSKRTA
jgi:hypothetical protein